MWLTAQVNGWRLVVGTPPEGVSDAPEFRINPVSRLRGWEIFPLWGEGQWIGMMGVREDPQPLTEEQQRLIEVAVFLVATALKNAQLVKRAHKMNAVDELTGCLARRHGEELIEAELRRADRSSTTASMIFLDLDRFKAVNDHYGHLYGDKVLANVGRVLKRTLRGSDLRCRYGGEEFVLLLPGTPLAGAQRVAESIRQAVGRETVETSNGPLSITASFGVTVALPGEVNTKSVLARADAAMYRAKKEGRNAVRVWEDTPETKRMHPRNVNALRRRESSETPESDSSKTALDDFTSPGLDDLD
jgi:diguanylate cyclase (GGDEF)-like protein